MPRAAMSVATSTRYCPLLKPPSACVRCACERLPWIRSRLNAGRTEDRRHTVGAVLRPGEHQRILDFAAFQQREQQRRLQVLRHRIDRLRDADGRRRPPLILIVAGLRSISRASSAIGGGIVALKNSV